MPTEVSQVWLWTAQNAFLTETDPASGIKWADRYGVAYGKGFKKAGNVESFLSYKKLHRTGRLLRGLKVKKISNGDSVDINLYNNVPYAADHEQGLSTEKATVKAPYVENGASGVLTGGDVEARPSMNPSDQVLNSPAKLIGEKMRELGW